MRYFRNTVKIFSQGCLLTMPVFSVFMYAVQNLAHWYQGIGLILLTAQRGKSFTDFGLSGQQKIQVLYWCQILQGSNSCYMTKGAGPFAFMAMLSDNSQSFFLCYRYFLRGLVSIWSIFLDIGISNVKIRQSSNHLISITGIPILLIGYLYIETAHWSLCYVDSTFLLVGMRCLTLRSFGNIKHH